MTNIRITISFLITLFLANAQVQEMDSNNEVKSISFKSNTSQSELPILLFLNTSSSQSPLKHPLHQISYPFCNDCFCFEV